MMVSRLTGGHTDSVLCVDVSPLSSVTASGGENELCLWSKTGQLLHKYIHQPSAPCTSVLFSRRKPNLLYAAFDREVLIFDTDQLQIPLFTFCSNEDEVCQIVLDEQEHFMAACDDEGQIKVFDLQERKVHRSLEGGHSSIVSSLVFCGGHQPGELVSGGLDSRLVHWDLSQCKALSTHDTQHLDGSKGISIAYMFNPPLVHHLARNSDGSLIAAALENGLVWVLASGSKPLQAKVCLKAHQQAVTQVYFISNTLLVTAGNDAHIVVWDLNKCKEEDAWAQGDAAANWNDSANNDATESDSKDNDVKDADNDASNDDIDGDDEGADDDDDDDAYTDDEDDDNDTDEDGDDDDDHADSSKVDDNFERYQNNAELCRVSTVKHGAKVNWMAPFQQADTWCVAVADCTTTITIYPLTMT